MIPCSKGKHYFMKLLSVNMYVGTDTPVCIFSTYSVDCHFKVWKLLFYNKLLCTFIHSFNKYLVKDTKRGKNVAAGWYWAKKKIYTEE